MHVFKKKEFGRYISFLIFIFTTITLGINVLKLLFYIKPSVIHWLRFFSFRPALWHHNAEIVVHFRSHLFVDVLADAPYSILEWNF